MKRYFPFFENNNTTLIGILWMLSWAASFSTTMSLAKIIQPTISVTMMLFMRCLFGVCFFLPFVLRNQTNTFKTDRLPLHLLRAVLASTSMLCTYHAYSNLPLAFTTSIGFTAPLIISILSIFFLGEHVGKRKWLAIVAGYLGVLVMVNPVGHGVDLNVGIALMANLFASCAIIITKKLSRTESTTTIMSYFMVSGLIMSASLVAFSWKTPALSDLLVLCVMGATATLSQFSYFRALKHADASTVAPFEYSRLVFAIPVGFFFFGELVSWHTLVGSVIIVAATYAISVLSIEKKRITQPS